MREEIRYIIEQFGIVEESKIVSGADLEGKEEIVLWQEPLKSSWNTDENW